jgi:3-deoxy-manno-octulosonate cytidylyltransferase (CMP-KDO synthetase)
VTDVQGYALYFSKRLIPHLPAGALDEGCRRCGCTSASMPTGPKRWTVMSLSPVSELETLEGLEQLRFLASGMRIAVVDVETPPFALRELNNPEDVAPIEQALAEAGLE